MTDTLAQSVSTSEDLALFIASVTDRALLLTAPGA